MARTSRVVIIGGGFGGLETALSLRHLLRTSVEINLIDRNDHQTFIPSIHEIVSGRTRAADIQIPLDTVLAAADVQFLRNDVTSIDLASRTVRAGDQDLPFDYLVLAAGAENDLGGIPGASEHASRFRSAADAESIFDALEDARTSGRDVRVLLAGGGTEGVEVAGELADVLGTGKPGSPAAGTGSVEIVGAKERLLHGFPPKAQEFAENRLREKGVRITLGNPITSVRSEQVTLASGETRPMTMLVWTGGVRPPQLLEDLPLSKGPGGWLKVTGELRSPDDERVFGLGDAVTIFHDDAPLALPRQAYHALDQALAVSLNIARMVEGRPLNRYEPRRRPQLISIGSGDGLFVQGDRVRTGPWVTGLKKMTERRHLMTCLTRAMAAPLTSRLPGAELFHQIRRAMPF